MNTLCNQSPIAITGVGMVTGLGDSPDSVWQRVVECNSSFGAMPALESEMPEGHSGAQAVELPPDFEPALPREARYLKWSIMQALRNAGIDPAAPPYPPERCGIILGTTLHGMRAGGEFLRNNNFSALRNFLSGDVLQRAIDGFVIGGDAITTCSACSSSLGSIALAVTLLNAGELDLVISGGYDATSEYVYAGFNSLRLVATGPLRPFAKDRLGMKLGEGYGVVVLENTDAATRRGGRVIAHVLGWGESADSHHLTQPHPDGAGAAQAIRDALKRACLTPSDIDLVAAHATGTPDNDSGESAAIRAVFSTRAHAVPIVGLKSHLGHTLGGAGANELILSALAMRDSLLPGCAGTRPDEIEFTDLSVSTGCARPGKVRATLNTSLGFGGANTAAILGKSPPLAAPTSDNPPALRKVYITGIGVVLPGAIGMDAFARLLRSGNRTVTDSGPVPEEQYVHLLNARRIRRMSDYVKLSLAATTLACNDARISIPMSDGEKWCAILGTTHGSASYCHDYYRQIVSGGMAAANPILFAEGVPNAAAAHLSLMLSLKGACQTVIGSRTAGLDAIRLAALRIATGDWDRAIVGAAEEYAPVINDAYRHCGVYSGESVEGSIGFATGAGAVTLVLESQDSLNERDARAHGLVESTSAITFRSKNGSCDAARLFRNLGNVMQFYPSTNRTSLDDLEYQAIRDVCPTAQTFSLNGVLPEMFSVTPLASIVAGLLMGTDRQPFGVSCFSYSNTASAIRIGRDAQH